MRRSWIPWRSPRSTCKGNEVFGRLLVSSFFFSVFAGRCCKFFFWGRRVEILRRWKGLRILLGALWDNPSPGFAFRVIFGLFGFTTLCRLNWALNRFFSFFGGWWQIIQESK